MESLIFQTLLDALATGKSAALVTIIETTNSVPRRAGSKMLVFPDGSITGTIGGGEMESRVVAEALEALESRQSRLVSYELTDPRRGDPGVCGGTVNLYVEPHVPEPTLLIVGAGHVGQAIATLASQLGFKVVVSDDRSGLADSVEDAHVALTGSVDDALTAEPATTETFVVLVTRNADLDLAALPLLLQTPARYIGVMGSKRRWGVTRDRLLEAGIESAQLDRIHTPIGVEIHAETPNEIAVSIMAEIIAVRRES